MAPFKMGRDAKAVDFLGRVIDQLAASDAIELGPHSAVSINGHAADLQVYLIKSRPAFVGAIIAIQRGSYVHVLDVGSTARSWDDHEAVLLHALRELRPQAAVAARARSARRAAPAPGRTVSTGARTAHAPRSTPVGATR